ncbi:NAD(P)-dependent oxidoreductase [Erwinia endophytica]|uniref:NAD(P)-dependent oxidoreductase n=1 Tax=Erwinia endophytica TaxID=1563158 RepID=UPI0012660511|nr:NAD(P)-dependent oxidoreductase [Erwinia endophytica]KAB8307503.1 NAD(P)-dependent oxidoreductase [Erwinia endophytica]
MKTIAIVAPGAMGSALAGVLHRHRLEVLTLLDGRSQASLERAKKAGMKPVSAHELMQAEVILSVVPPASAISLAQQLAPYIAAAMDKPLYVDCNAVSEQTLKQIAEIILPTGAAFVDGAIIGLPPVTSQDRVPRLWFAGEQAGRLAELENFGLSVSVMQAATGAASALKMSYAGINKGITLLCALMLINASRVGAADALLQQMEESQPSLLARLRASIPDMYNKAWRWAPEMEEIARLNAGEVPGAALYQALAAFCRQMAEDQQHDGDFVPLLNAFLQAEKRS